MGAQTGFQSSLASAPAQARVPRRAFIESPRFPAAEVSEASAVEKGPGRPPHWEMVFWWTRKPLISARAIIAGCLLPEGTNPKEFLRMIGIGGKRKAAHSNPPLYRFEGVRLLDPFAGFGSIPLEGIRLGLDVTAVELLPTAYVFLKAILEYPAKYGKKLVEDVERWGKWVTERLREDPLIRQLYDEDVAVYIGSWEVKCPNCGRWTPLVGNWWLARVKGEKGYARLAWMEPFVEGGEVKIRVVDLNKALGSQALEKATVRGSEVEADGAKHRIPESNINARRETAICLQCGQPIAKIDPQTGKHYAEAEKLPKDVKDRLEGYVKYAIKTYNQSLEQEGVAPLARQRLLVKVKVKNGDLEFEPCTDKDQQKLELARKEVEKMLREGDPDIPKEKLAPYGTQAIGGYLQPLNYYMNEWFKLFNPRQLITLVKLVKLIREAGEKIREENHKEEQTKEEAHMYAEAVTTYLAIALVRYAGYSNAVTPWKNYTGFGSSLALLRAVNIMVFRGIAMNWNWTDYNSSFNGTGFSRDIKSLTPLVEIIRTVGDSKDKIKVFLDDATVLNKLDDEKFNLIVTDPPYYDDVPYAELSDFYYVWLKRALSDVEGGRLVPRFLPEAFFERVGDGWVEVSTQWEKYALSEVSLNPPRLGADAKYEDGVRHFQNLLNASFVAMASRLEDDGLLVTYYAHTDPDAWKALLKAGWEAAGLRVTNAFPVTTESAQSVVKRGKLSMDTSIVVVWRKGASGSIEASKLYDECVEASAERARLLMEAGAVGRDLFIGALAAALARATSYREVIAMGRLNVDNLVDSYVYPATCLGLARALARKAGLTDGIRSPDVMFYVLVKSLTAGGKTKVVESTDLRIFSIGTSLDAKAAIGTLRLLEQKKVEEGAEVAKAKAFALMEPTSAERRSVEELLERRGVGVSQPNIRCAVDALHYLELLALRHSADEYKRRLEELRAKHPTYVEEALAVAKVLSEVLPESDPEKRLCTRILQPAL